MEKEVIIIAISVYFVVTLLLGYFAGRGTKTFNDLAMGTKWGTAAIVCTSIATNFGAGTFFRDGGEVLRLGPIVTACFMGRTLGYVLKGYLFGSGFSYFKDCYSTADIMHKLYGSTARYITGIMTLLVAVTGIVLQTKFTSLILTKLIGTSPMQGVIISLSIVAIYTMFGGMKAVVNTDKLQMGLIFLFAIVIVVFITKKIGSPSEILSSYNFSQISLGKHFFNFNLSEIGSYINYFLVSAVFSVDIVLPHGMLRLLMNKDSFQLKKTSIIIGIGQAVINIFVMFMALACLKGFGEGTPQDGVEMFFKFNSEILPSWTFPIVVLGILSIIMSTADSIMHAGSVSIARDILSPILKRPSSKSDYKVSVVIISVVSFFMYFVVDTKVFKTTASHTSLLVAPLLVVPIFLAFRGFKNSKKHFWINSIISFAVFFFIKATGSPYALFISLVTNIFTFFLLRKINNIPIYEKFIKTPGLFFTKILYPKDFFFISIKSQYWVRHVEFCSYYLMLETVIFLTGIEREMSLVLDNEYILLKIAQFCIPAVLITREMWHKWQKRFFGPLWILTLLISSFMGTYVYVIAGENMYTLASFMGTTFILFSFVEIYRASIIHILGALSAIFVSILYHESDMMISLEGWGFYLVIQLLILVILVHFRDRLPKNKSPLENLDHIENSLKNILANFDTQAFIDQDYNQVKPSERMNNIISKLNENKNNGFQEDLVSQLREAMKISQEYEKGSIHKNINLKKISFDEFLYIIKKVERDLGVSFSFFMHSVKKDYTIDPNILYIFLYAYAKEYIKKQEDIDSVDKSLTLIISDSSLSYISKEEKMHITNLSALVFLITEDCYRPEYASSDYIDPLYNVDILTLDPPTSFSQEKLLLYGFVREHYGKLVEKTSNFDHSIIHQLIIPIDVSKIRPGTLDLAYPKGKYVYNWPEADKLEEKVLSDIKNRAYFASQDKVKVAIDIIKNFHAHQKRKSGEPYYMHPLYVCSILLDIMSDKTSSVYEILKAEHENAVIAALLHDILEDTKFTIINIMQIFGTKVADYVLQVTKIDHKARSRMMSNEEAFSKLMQQEPIAVCIKIADRIHNLQTINGHPSIKKRKEVAEETLKFFIKPAEKLGLNKFAEMMKEISIKILEDK